MTGEWHRSGDRQHHTEHHPDRVRGLHRPHYRSQTQHSHGLWQVSDIDLEADHRSITPKFVTTTALSCIANIWRSTTLSPPKKFTSSTVYLEWCHVHFIRDSYSTFIRRVIGPSKNSMEIFFNAKFDFKSTWNRDWTISHHTEHPVCQSPAGDAEKATNV